MLFEERVIIIRQHILLRKTRNQMIEYLNLEEENKILRVRKKL